MLIAPKWLAIAVVFASIVNVAICARSIRKRESAIDELVSKALSIVQPIFDVDKRQLAQSDTMIPAANLDALNPLLSDRDNQILGARKYDKLDDVPICKGNSGICKFVSCTAQNFKNDESFDNLNMAVQVLSDREMRQTISSDPDVMNIACSERDLSPSQCKLFTTGFQLIDKFMTSIEDMNAKGRRRIIVDHSRDADPTSARQFDERPSASPHSHRKSHGASLTSARHDGRVHSDTRRSPSRTPSHRHSSTSHADNVHRTASRSASGRTHRRTIIVRHSNEEKLIRQKRADDYYDEVAKLERRQGHHRGGERRRHPSSHSSSGHSATAASSSGHHRSGGGHHGGSASVAHSNDGKGDYYSNYEAEEVPETHENPLDCLKLLDL